MKKILTVLLTLILVFSACVSFTGCSKDGKYDVTIRIACDDGDSWVFPPDVSEIRVERRFDTYEHKYYVDAYQLSKKPGWKDVWISPSSEGANVFQVNLSYRDESGQVSETKRVFKRGEYCLHIYASKTSTLWNARIVKLYITVK